MAMGSTIAPRVRNISAARICPSAASLPPAVRKGGVLSKVSKWACSKLFFSSLRSVACNAVL